MWSVSMIKQLLEDLLGTVFLNFLLSGLLSLKQCLYFAGSSPVPVSDVLLAYFDIIIMLKKVVLADVNHNP